MGRHAILLGALAQAGAHAAVGPRRCDEASMLKARHVRPRLNTQTQELAHGQASPKRLLCERRLSQDKLPTLRPQAPRRVVRRLVGNLDEQDVLPRIRERDVATNDRKSALPRGPFAEPVAAAHFEEALEEVPEVWLLLVGHGRRTVARQHVCLLQKHDGEENPCERGWVAIERPVEASQPRPPLDDKRELQGARRAGECLSDRVVTPSLAQAAHGNICVQPPRPGAASLQTKDGHPRLQDGLNKAQAGRMGWAAQLRLQALQKLQVHFPLLATRRLVSAVQDNAHVDVGPLDARTLRERAERLHTCATWKTTPDGLLEILQQGLGGRRKVMVGHHALADEGTGLFVGLPKWASQTPHGGGLGGRGR
mmetsp:Transcript_39018/g.107458  ORF Transcript_39018/g.107458 Transcript_39018/m.107458 type:complete len:367 (-) Transcript_39018:246-1346(-)